MVKNLVSLPLHARQCQQHSQKSDLQYHFHFGYTTAYTSILYYFGAMHFFFYHIKGLDGFVVDHQTKIKVKSQDSENIYRKLIKSFIK